MVGVGSNGGNGQKANTMMFVVVVVVFTGGGSKRSVVDTYSGSSSQLRVVPESGSGK